MFININGGEPIQRVYECWFSEQLQDKTRATMLCAATVHFYDQGKTFRRAFIHLSCSRIKTFRWIVPTSSWLEISLRNYVHLDAGSDNSPIKHVQTLSNPFVQDITILNIAWNSYAISIKSSSNEFRLIKHLWARFLFISVQNKTGNDKPKKKKRKNLSQFCELHWMNTI